MPKIGWVTVVAMAMAVVLAAWMIGGWVSDHKVAVVSVFVILGLLVIVVMARHFIVVGKIRRLLVRAADQALRDPLTGLANRALFHDRLTHAMQLHQRDNQSVAVLSLDLDDFKMVNDNLGHPAGDALLVLAAERILGCVRASDTVARLGGDEFAVLLEGRAEDSHLVAHRLVQAFDAPFLIDGHDLLVRPSVGLAVASDKSSDASADALLKQAEWLCIRRSAREAVACTASPRICTWLIRTRPVSPWEPAVTERER
jgi:diguanylate cyclase (GGDEF)-like protein